MEELSKKYGEEFLQIQGIANKHLDISHFSKEFFGNSSNIADVSVDGNANVKEKNISQYNYQANKSIMRLNGLYMMYKNIVKYFDEQTANEALEKVFNGELFINDLHLYSNPYSYYGKTSIMVRINGQVKFVTMENLFDMFSDKVDILPDREQIWFDQISYTNKDFVSNNTRKINVSYHNRHSKKRVMNITEQVVKQKQLIEVWDNGKWVKLNRVLRHKKDTDMILYQTKSGRTSLVTSNHPVILNDRSQIYADKLQIGHQVIGQDSIPFVQKTISVDSNFAYLIGFLLGDGNSTRHRFYNKERCNLSDKQICIEYDRVRGSNHIYQKDIKQSKIYRVLSQLFTQDKLNVKQHRVSFANLDFDILCKKYFGMMDRDYSFNKCLPVNILSWTDASINSLMCGLIDSQGTINRDNAVSIRMKGMAIIQQLQSILNSRNIYVSVNYYKDIQCWGIVIPICDYMINESQKVSKIQNIKQYKPQYNTIDRNDHKITKIIRIDKSVIWNSYGIDNLEWVYDITTETGTFTSGMMTQHNCYAFDLRSLMIGGMDFFGGNIKIKPPKHSNSFIDLFIQTNAYISNQIAGASSYPDFFVILDWFYRKEFGDDYTERMKTDETLYRFIRQQFQNVTYSLNFPYRGGQSSFTNFSVMDRGFMNSLFKGYVYPMDNSYPVIDSVIELSKRYFEYYTEINSEEGIFTFPVTTLAIAVDKDNNYEDPQFAEWASEINSKKALANMFMGASTVFSSCCRLANDFAKVSDTGFQNSFGVGGLSIGSHRVCGINMARMGHLENVEHDINHTRFAKNLDLVHAVLYSHRKLIQERVAQGVLPLYTYHWMNLNRQYSTIGLIGAYEYVTNQGMDITTLKGMNRLKSALKIIQNKITGWQQLQKLQKCIYNIEQVPGQTIAIRTCKCDTVLGYNPNEYKMYSNQYLPLIKDVSIYDRMKLQGQFDNFTTGGAICHINVNDDKPISKEQFFNLMNLAKQLGVRYWAINYAYSQCEEGHFSIGNDDNCPVCQKKIINKYTRVVGFLTPVNSWSNIRRQYEFPNRKFYKNGQLTVN